MDFSGRSFGEARAMSCVPVLWSRVPLPLYGGTGYLAEVGARAVLGRANSSRRLHRHPGPPLKHAHHSLKRGLHRVRCLCIICICFVPGETPGYTRDPRA